MKRTDIIPVLRHTLDSVKRASCALVLAFALLALGTGSTFAADAQVIVVQPADSMTLAYDPATVTVTAGSTITWVNQSAAPVTVTSPDGLFDSEQIAPGASFSARFDTPGTYRYFCVQYPHMKGVVVVTAGGNERSATGTT